MILLLLGCAGKDSDIETPVGTPFAGYDGPVVFETWAAVTDADGLLRIPVEIDAGDVFQVVVKRDRGLVATEYIYGPDDRALLDWEDWYDSEESLTEAIYVTEFATTVDWPSRAVDGPLAAGTYTVSIATLSPQYSPAGDAEVEITVLRRPEPDPVAGELRVVIAYAGGLEADAEVVRGTEAATAYWAEMYASYGIALTTTFTTIDVDPAMPDTYEGLEEVEALVSAFDAPAVLVVMGDEIAGDQWTYGEAGGIPGPYIATQAASVEIAWLSHAGADGEFSDRDILLMGETMAHEVGHYLGLFHPVEDGWDYRDAIDDTPACQTMNACESDLGANLMFPYSLCFSRTDCTRQAELTEGQIGVAQRYVGVE